MSEHDNDDPLGAVEDTLLTEEETAAAIAEARAKYGADAKAKAKKAVVAAEVERLKRVEGQKTGDGYKDEPIFITVDLPEYSARLVVNGEPFYHGQTYQRPRHVVESLREMIARAWGHQDDIDGKSMAQRLSRHRMANWDKLEGARI